MFKDVSILIPYKPDNGPRDAAFKWIKLYLMNMMPNAEICLGSCDTKLFSRSEAINEAAKKATRDIYVISDADFFYDPKIITRGIDLLKEHAWIIPYNRIHYIQPGSTKKIIESNPIWPLSVKVESHLENREKVGGLNIIPRKYFEEVGGFDERFIGWGLEDRAFANTVNTICGNFARMDAEVFHLWHSTQNVENNPNYHDSRLLFQRYLQATGDKEKMRKVIQEKRQS
ncbi:galactosyltransferase-related protein [Cytobacillus firmus]|uniref:galactosyltransferase-related protein n=1 Tax=Cytobacillus firmus TaxID=1399 RepID=UPI002494EA98|nr:galactosyltransferase-related protein [Cytobacillus firmus]